MKRSIVAIVALFVLAVPVFAWGSTWQIDPDHSSFQFKIRHLTVSKIAVVWSWGMRWISIWRSNWSGSKGIKEIPDSGQK